MKIDSKNSLQSQSLRFRQISESKFQRKRIIPQCQKQMKLSGQEIQPHKPGILNYFLQETVTFPSPVKSNFCQPILWETGKLLVKTIKSNWWRGTISTPELNEFTTFHWLGFPQELTTRCAHGRSAGVDHSTALRLTKIKTDWERGPIYLNQTNR